MKQQLQVRSSLMALFVALLLAGCGASDQEVAETSVVTSAQQSTADPIEKPLFTKMSPEQTGMYFLNEMRENEKLNILTYEYLYNGGGVAIGDVNNDGLPDVFFSGNLFGGRLYLNKGNLQFEQISETAGVFYPGFTTGVVMVDINGDGYDDIYLCRSLSEQAELRANVLLINNQDNTFTDRAAAYGLADQGFSNHANFFDYDNDGDLDMYLLNHRVDFDQALAFSTYKTQENSIDPNYENHEFVTDRLYRNNGDGTFSDVTQQAGLINKAYGLSVTAADINQDGWTDLFVANDYVGKDHLYINNGNGTFTDRIDEMFDHICRNAMGSDIADFNNDGLLDVVNLDMMAEGNYRNKQLKGQSPFDFVMMAEESGYGLQVNRNTLQLNNGDGTFSEIAQLAGISHTDWSWTPLFADFDNDGYKDLFITNGYYRDVTDMDYMKYESNEAIQAAGGHANVNEFALVQLMHSTPTSNYVYQNNGDLTFSNQSKAWGVDAPVFSNGAVYVDLDLDGDLDLLTNNFNAPADVYRNNASELRSNNKSISIRLIGNAANPDAVGAKVTLITDVGMQFQECSPYKGYLSSNSAMLHFGVGSASKNLEVQVVWPNGNTTVVTGLEANHQVLELRMEEANNEVITIETSEALMAEYTPFDQLIKHQENDYIDFKREPLLEHSISQKGPFLSKGDVNGDGLEDFYVGGATGQAGQLFVQVAGGKFKLKTSAAFAKDVQHEDVQSTFFDADQDGDLDLFVVSGGYESPLNSPLYQDRLYLNDGKGNFSSAEGALPALFENGSCVIHWDVDGDGDLDLFVGGNAQSAAYPYCSKSQLLLNDGGVFTATDLLPQSGALGMLNDALLLDYDADGDQDLILAGEWMPVTILRNDGPGKPLVDVTAEAQLHLTAGWWNCLEAADMDNDGDLDLIAGNRGENSFYNASQAQPASIYAKDFDANGSIDALPFYYFSDGVAHPKHTLDEIAAHYPSIRRKFQRYKQFSEVALSTFFTAEELKGALNLKAHTFSSAYIENKGDGTFALTSLPPAAQFSEVQGILPTDVNGDGKLDLILTGNQYLVDVETGRSDGSYGAVLLGDGAGAFQAIPASESGFSAGGNTRGVVELMAGAESVILVLLNDGASQAFRTVY